MLSSPTWCSVICLRRSKPVLASRLSESTSDQHFGRAWAFRVPLALNGIGKKKRNYDAGGACRGLVVGAILVCNPLRAMINTARNSIVLRR